MARRWCLLLVCVAAVVANQNLLGGKLPVGPMHKLLLNTLVMSSSHQSWGNQWQKVAVVESYGHSVCLAVYRLFSGGCFLAGVKMWYKISMYGARSRGWSTDLLIPDLLVFCFSWPWPTAKPFTTARESVCSLTSDHFSFHTMWMTTCITQALPIRRIHLHHWLSGSSSEPGRISG